MTAYWCVLCARFHDAPEHACDRRAEISVRDDDDDDDAVVGSGA